MRAITVLRRFIPIGSLLVDRNRCISDWSKRHEIAISPMRGLVGTQRKQRPKLFRRAGDCLSGVVDVTGDRLYQLVRTVCSGTGDRVCITCHWPKKIVGVFEDAEG